MENGKNKGGNFFVGFFLGGLVGAMLIFLLGTEEGKKTAKKLTKKLGSLEDELKEKGGELWEEAGKAKEKLVKDVNKKNISKAVSVKMDQALTGLEKIQRKGVKLTRDVHGRFFQKAGKKLTK